MRKPKINDRKLLRLLDKDGKSQSEAARELGVHRENIRKVLSGKYKTTGGYTFTKKEIT